MLIFTCIACKNVFPLRYYFWLQRKQPNYNKTKKTNPDSFPLARRISMSSLVDYVHVLGVVSLIFQELLLVALHCSEGFLFVNLEPGWLGCWTDMH